MRRTHLLLAAAALCVGAIAPACAGAEDKSAEELTEDLASEIERRSEALDQAQATCYAELLVDEVGADELQDVDLSADAPPDELQRQLASVASQATTECNLDDLG